MASGFCSPHPSFGSAYAPREVRTPLQSWRQKKKSTRKKKKKEEKQRPSPLHGNNLAVPKPCSFSLPRINYPPSPSLYRGRDCVGAFLPLTDEKATKVHTPSSRRRRQDSRPVPSRRPVRPPRSMKSAALPFALGGCILETVFPGRVQEKLWVPDQRCRGTG